MNEKRTERKRCLILLILLAFIAVLGTILILFVPVTGTGDREFVPTVMIAFAIGCLIGLPIIRASVDHGTGFGHAGDGHANELSLINAMDYGIRMANAKREAAGAQA